MRHEVGEQLELLRRQLDRLARNGDVVRLAVEQDVAERERVAAILWLAAPQHRLHARDELARRERLRDVVVGADLEPDDPVGLLVARGEHQDRNVRAGAHLAADVEAVLARQADVEQHEPDRMPLELDQRLVAVPHPDHAVAVARQVAADELADRRLVLDEEDCPGHTVEGTQRTTRTRTAGPPSIRIVVAFMPRRSV